MDLLRSLPIGLYLEQPSTWLHRLDPRVKLAWLMTFFITPLLANLTWRLLLPLVLVLLTILIRIPLRVWRRQIGWLLAACLLVGTVTAVMPDGLAIQHQPRRPQPDLVFAFDAPFSSVAPVTAAPTAAPSSASGTPTASSQIGQPTAYRYVLFHQGPVLITRRSLELGLRVSSLLFTLIYGTNLYLLTTAPEEITTALDTLFRPLQRWRVPITEITLTLTLALRFIPLVLEEVQNLIRSVRTRAIQWKKLGVRGAIKLWLMLADRLLENLFMRAEQIASAMQVRGFTSPGQHHVQWHQLQIRYRDWVALALMFAVWGARVWLGNPS